MSSLLFKRPGRLGTLATLAALSALLATENAQAITYLDLAQMPAASSFKSIAPNITFLLDDSGSMQFEFLGTSGTVEGYSYGFPPGNTKVYGGGGYGDDFAPFSASDANAAQYRSAYVNPNYYNPAVDYTPFACTGPYQQSSADSPSLYAATQYAGSPDVNGQYCHWDAKAKLWVMPDAKPRTTMLNPALGGSWRSLDVWNDSTNSNNNVPNNGYVASASTKFVNGWKSRTKNGFWPATYFNYLGPTPGTNTDFKAINNYQLVQICPPAAAYTTNSNGVKSNDTITVNQVAMPICSAPPPIPPSPQANHTYLDAAGNYVHVKADGSQVVRSYAQEMQNFANWYQYYRSHILMARAGIGQAFMKMQPNFRVNYALLNKAASDSTNPVQYSTTHAFDLAQSRTDFMERLYQTPIPPQGTPSRSAVYNVGRWLSRKPDASAPWGPRDAERQALNQQDITSDADMLNNLSCRQNYLVFATDGDWNGDGPNVGNVDNTAGNAITSADGNTTFTYKPVAPYKDAYSNTLADVAMYFWKRDIQTGLPNDVPVNSADPAFWQHVVLYGVGLGVQGSANQASMLNGTANWPDPTQSALYRIDDLAHGGLNSRGGYLSAADPTTFAQALGSTLLDIVNRTQSSTSAAINTQPAGQYKTSTQAFFASYHPNNWWGQLTAYSIVRTTNGGLTNAASANWDASCVLTGGSCPAMGEINGVPATTIAVQAPGDRTILSWNDNTGLGVPMEFASLPPAMQSLTNAAIVDYLRGVRSGEQANGGSLRNRTSVLGDIVGSSPIWVGAPGASYPATLVDKLFGGTQPESSYAAFQTANIRREHVVYAGANDGLLHGFRAGSNAANGDFDAATNDGREVLAYLPAGVIDTISQYTTPTYHHRFYVDATPGAGDLFYGSAWHTWLVGGLGAGGRSIYALDITDPTQFAQANAATLVRKEVTPGNIDSMCGGPGACSNDLGNTFGTPVIRRMHNGQWAVIFGNGYNSPNGSAVIFIALIDKTTGSWSIKKIDTMTGPAQDPSGQGRANGIAYVTAADLDGDKIADYLYATDLFGNVWRVDVTGKQTSDWAVRATPVYSARDAANGPQAITTAPVVSAVAQDQAPDRIVVMFATGKMLETADQSPTAQTQTVYGVWDGDMGGWNGKAGQAVKYAAWSATPSPALSRASLQAQTLKGPYTLPGDTVSYRSISSNPVCWQGASGIAGCSTYDKYGWYADLRDSSNREGEMVIYNPVLLSGALQLNTTVPSTASGLTCSAPAAGGYTMAFNPATGGASESSFFADSNNKFVQIGAENLSIMGVGLNATGSIAAIRDGDSGSTFDVLNQNGDGKYRRTKDIASGGGGRVTWIQLR